MVVSIDDLENPDLFIKVPDVPLLDEHVLKGKDGKVTVNADRNFLEEVARNCNRRFENTGDAVALIVGHTSDSEHAEEKPVVGYAINFHVKDFLNSEGKKVSAIYADLYYRSDKRHVINDYPRRSVELWVERKDIDPIALLGGTTPERDLGIIRYSRDHQLCYRYSLESRSMPVDQGKLPPSNTPAASGALKSDDISPPSDPTVAKFLQSKEFRELFDMVKELAEKVESQQEFLDEVQSMLEEEMESQEGAERGGKADDGSGDDGSDDGDWQGKAADEKDSRDDYDPYDDDDDDTDNDDDDSDRDGDEEEEVEQSRLTSGRRPVKFNTVPSSTNAKMSRESQQIIAKLQRQVRELTEKDIENTVKSTIDNLRSKRIVLGDERKLAYRIRVLYSRGGKPALDEFVNEIETHWQREDTSADPTDTMDIVQYQRAAGQSKFSRINSKNYSDIASRARKLVETQNLSVEDALAKAYSEIAGN